ncbi:MAG: hypothetical protein RIC55_20385 [Pirellulaceae bacterium]
MLRFSPTAWAKLIFLRDCGDTEVGGFGVSAKDDPLLVEDVRLVRQNCTAVSVEFDDEAVADFFDEQVDLGRRPEQFARLWLHTHPGDSARPSGVDEKTFARCFGRSDWAVMFILAEEGETYARLRFNVGPGGSIVIPVEIDFERPFAAADHDSWTEEYCAHVFDTAGIRADLFDQRWETIDPSQLPHEFLDAWSDYVDDEDGPLQHERYHPSDDVPI